MSDDRGKALEAAVTQIKKQYGDGAVMRLGEAQHLRVASIPTGSLALDLALGVGGIPRGRVTEIYGPEASGKTTLAQHIVAEAQRAGGVCAYIDMEHALDPEYAERTGVNVEELYISQPDTGEQALEIAETLVRSGAVEVVVVDSVAALVPRAEIEGDMGDPVMGMQARLMFGNPETTTGGRALKFYASVRMDMRRIESIKVGQEVVGNRTRVRVVKNKVAPPFKVAEFDIMYNEGISKAGGVLDLGVEFELIDKRGSYYSYGEERLGQGRENAKDFLREHPELASELEGKIRAAAGIGKQPVDFDKPVEED
jgi:recombination protein RecA